MITKQQGSKVLASFADAQQRTLLAEREARKKEKFLNNLIAQVDEQRKELQEIFRQKDLALEDIRLIAEKKQDITAKVELIKKQFSEAREALQNEVDKRIGFIETSKEDIRQGRQTVAQERSALYSEIEISYKKLEEEIQKRTAELENAQTEQTKKIQALEERKIVLTKIITYLEEKIKEIQDNYEKDLEARQELLLNYKQSADKEISQIVEKKNSLSLTLSEALKKAEHEIASKYELSEFDRLKIQTEIQDLQKEELEIKNRKLQAQTDFEKLNENIVKQIQANSELVQAIKDGQEQEIEHLVFEKENLKKEGLVLDQKIKEKKNVLEQEQVRVSKFLESSSQELKESQSKVEEARTSLSKIKTQIQETEPVAKELSEFIDKEQEARDKFLQQQTELAIVESKYNAVKIEMDTKIKEAQTGMQDLDGMKIYVTDLYGKLASYVNVAKETLEYINDELKEKGVPMHFAIPSDEIIEINLDNFNKE